MASHRYPICLRTAMARYLNRLALRHGGRFVSECSGKGCDHPSHRKTGPETVRRLRDFTLEVEAGRIANGIANRM